MPSHRVRFVFIFNYRVIAIESIIYFGHDWKSIDTMDFVNSDLN